MQITWLVNVGRQADFDKCNIVNPTFICFGETSDYRSVQFFTSFSAFSIGHHLGTTFTGTDGNRPNYRIGSELDTIAGFSVKSKLIIVLFQ